MPQKFLNLDANQSVFFARELEHIKSKTYDIRYPQLKATTMIPVSGEAGSGAEQITYEQHDRVGIMKIIANYADDLPRADVLAKQFTTQVKSLGGSYGFNVQEVRSAQMAGKPLNARKATAVRKAYEQEVNTIGWFADGSAAFGGLTGFLYNPNITVVTATNGNWIASATPDQIIADINKPIHTVRDITLGTEEIDTILLPSLEYGHIATTPRSGTSDTTILEFVKRVNPGVTFDWVNELKNVNPAPSGGAATNVMITYKKNIDNLSYEIPQGFEQFKPQERGLEFIVPAHGRNGGVLIYYPLSVHISEGI